MASKISTTLIDDLDGGEAAETVEFGFAGVTYEIDLSADNAVKLRDTLQPWVDCARRTGGRKARHNTGPREDLGPVRQWARANGYTVGEKGRIPASVIQAFWDRDKVTKVRVSRVESTVKKVRAKESKTNTEDVTPEFSATN